MAFYVDVTVKTLFATISSWYVQYMSKEVVLFAADGQCLKNFNAFVF